MPKKSRTSTKARQTKKTEKTTKPWGGRFTEATDRLVEEYTASIPYDWRLYPYDIAGSIAHATMLAKTRIITKKEAARIIRGLDDSLKELVDGSFPFSI